MIDTDKNGLIGPDELLNAFNQLGEEMTKEEIAKLIRVFDWDCDGYINVLGLYLIVNYFCCLDKSTFIIVKMIR